MVNNVPEINSFRWIVNHVNYKLLDFVVVVGRGAGNRSRGSRHEISPIYIPNAATHTGMHTHTRTHTLTYCLHLSDTGRPDVKRFYLLLLLREGRCHH